MFRVLFCMILLSTLVFPGCRKQGQPRSDPGAPPPAAKAASAGPLSTQGEYPGITVTVQEVRRADETVTLKFVMNNQSQQSFALGYNFGEGAASVTDFDSIAGVHLIDSANKSYPVLRDTDHKCLCSRSIGGISAGSQVVLWAKFDSPPPDTLRVAVVVPHFPPVEGVPITHNSVAGETK